MVHRHEVGRDLLFRCGVLGRLCRHLGSKKPEHNVAIPIEQHAKELRLCH
jgi:hypothetical protein